MKKSLIIAAIASLMLTSTIAYADTQTNTAPQKQPCKCQKHNPPQMKRQSLDDRLKLTEEQKQKAHEIRMEGHKKIKPVIEKIKAKNEEIKTVVQSNLKQAEKDKKIVALKKDIRELKQEARKIRNENTKQFEAILTPEQKAEFEKIKQEAKAKHQEMKKHKKMHKPGYGPQGCPKAQPQTK